MSRQIPPSERIGVKYADYVAKGILLTERDGEIDIQTPDGTVMEALRKEVDRLKVELIAHLRTLPQRKETMSKTIEAPPHRLIVWCIRTLDARIAKGDMPPDGWMEWLETADKALTDSETVRIEILAATDIDSFIAKVF